MKAYEALPLALKGLKERKVRSALTIMMVVIGVALMTALNGMASGFDVFLNKQISNLAPNLLILSPEPFIGERFGSPQGPSIVLTDASLSILKSLPKVKEVYPAYIGGVKVSSKGKSLDKNLLGLEPYVIKKIVPSIEIHSGSMLNTGQSNGVMLGYNVAFPPDGPFAKVGDTITIEHSKVVEQAGVQKMVKDRRSFFVIGIFKPTDQITDNMIVVNMDVAKTLLKKESSYDRIYILTEDIKDNGFVESGIKQLYGDLVSVTSPQSIIKTVQELLSGWEAFVASIGGVSMIVGSIGILAALYTSVLERTREIGIMKAIGFSRGGILLLYLSESISIGILGGIIGLGAGMVAGQILTESVMRSLNAPPIEPVFLPESLLLVFLLAILFSVLAGIYPAWRASKLDPVVALRRE
ncbi:MAG: ABC transporter permease [Nitrososphaerales archaeon]